MDGDGKKIEIEEMTPAALTGALGRTRPFAGVEPAEVLAAVERAERVRVPAGRVLAGAGSAWCHYWVVLEGEVRIERPEPDGSWSLVGRVRAGEGLGEVALLTGRRHLQMQVSAVEDSTLARIEERDFWKMMACCGATRNVVLGDMAQRLQTHQIEALHREKLVSLGVMAAGLMHELHNPGAAARRAASLMRGNLLRLQQLSVRGAEQPPTAEQLECMRYLMERAFSDQPARAMSTIEQADAEESMAEWLRAAGAENANQLAPALVSAGLGQAELECARRAFVGPSLPEALNWLEALVSNLTLVATIEESIGRMSDLVMAVKKFAYEDRVTGREVDVHDSLQSALTILGHKLRVKGLGADKRFAASPAKIVVRGPSLSQVWTNLLDNAIDASAAGGKIEIATWSEPRALVVSVEDHGAGIPADVLPHIFEPFYTTKPQGAGTGLGLEIVHRIVTQNLGGSVEVASEPGRTRFVVRLPLVRQAECMLCGGT